MNCPFCGKENQPNSSTCDFCGAWIDDPALVNTKPGLQPDSASPPTETSPQAGLEPDGSANQAEILPKNKPYLLFRNQKQGMIGGSGGW